MEYLQVDRFTHVLRARVGCQQRDACIPQHPVLVEGQHIARADKPKQHQRLVFGDDMALAPVAREFQTLMAKYQPDKVVSYASMESFIAAKILVEAIRRSGADPTRAKVISQLQKMSSYEVGGFKVSFSPENRVGSKFVKVTVIDRDGKLLHKLPG